jgi:hypothetical protein
LLGDGRSQTKPSWTVAPHPIDLLLTSSLFRSFELSLQCWKEGAPAGSLLCGFELPQEYKRNDATLPKGRVYISFPIWTRDTLEHMQDQKKRILERASEALDLKNEELAKMQETGNIFLKALHYRNAAAAAEKYYVQPITRMLLVPSEKEVIPFHHDLFVTTKGTVWAKDLPNGKQTLLGAASMKAATPPGTQ